MTNPDGTCIDPFDCNGCGTCPRKEKQKPIDIDISTSLFGDDYELFKSVIEQGIDAHLEGFTESSFDEKIVNGQHRLVMKFVGKDIPILIRRLNDVGSEESMLWASDIKECHDTDEDDDI